MLPKAVHSKVLPFLRDRTGSALVEFSILAPLLFALTFGAVAYGYLFAIYTSVQHMAAEAARASIGGINETERANLAQTFAAANVSSYSFLESGRVTVTTAASGGATAPTFEVLVSYDLTGTPVYLFPFLPMPQSPLTLRAAVQRGGY